MRRALALAAVLLAPAALPTAAAGMFTPPDGCRLEVTVQNRGCTVSQHFRCEADPQGYQRLVLFGQDGPTHVSVIDGETRWIESSDPETGLTDLLDDEAADPASFTTLVKTGRDDFDFWTVSNSGERLHHVGWDELTGETAVIDGIKLERTRFHLTTSDASGAVLIEREGGQFISRAMGRFYGGKETSKDWTGETVETDDSPATFSFPGEIGFGNTTPQFDCDMLMTGLPGAGGGA